MAPNEGDIVVYKGKFFRVFVDLVEDSTLVGNCCVAFNIDDEEVHELAVIREEEFDDIVIMSREEHPELYI